MTDPHPYVFALANLAGPGFDEVLAPRYVAQVCDEDPQAVLDGLVAAGFLKREAGNICITYAGRLELRKPRGKPPRKARPCDEGTTPSRPSGAVLEQAIPPPSEKEGGGPSGSIQSPPADGLGSGVPSAEGRAEEAFQGRMIPDAIASLMEEGETVAQAKHRLTQLLWVEQAELAQVRGKKGENLKREAEIEYLLGLLARLGDT